MTPEINRVTAHWRELVSRPSLSHKLDETVSGEALDELLSAYSGARRHYHDLRHIDALLELAREYRSALIDPVAVELAIFYHDAVYEASRSDNEEVSAALAGDWLLRLGVAEELTSKVRRFIVATKHVGGGSVTAPDAVEAADTDLDYLLDFDLSVLAAEPAVYDAYAAAIRREYSIYPDFLYRRGRAGVLAKLSAMPSLYRTPALRALWETRARANLARELAGLS